MTNPKITPRDDGPLMVSNPPILRHRSGAEIETKDVAALCRCGLSSNKPFCDGSHRDTFTSAPDHTKIRNAELTYSGEVEGQDVTIAYTPVLCSHAGECSKRAASVFKPKEKPWVQPENGTLAEILEVMAACPSGALRVSVAARTDPQHLTRGEAEIEVEPHGPYWVKNVELEAEFNGVGASRAKYVLCRCGLSKNKPFCDGTHYDAGWRDDAE